MQAKHFFRASRFFAAVTLTFMTLTWLSTYDGFPFEGFGGGSRVIEMAPRPVEVTDTTRKPRTNHPRRGKEPVAEPAPFPTTPAAKTDAEPTSYTFIAFVATVISAAAGVISMLLGLRADRRESKKEAAYRNVPRVVRARRRR